MTYRLVRNEEVVETPPNKEEFKEDPEVVDADVDIAVCLEDPAAGNCKVIVAEAE